MAILDHWRTALAGAMCAACLAPAGADTLLDTGTPGYGMLGYLGYDVSVQQTVAVAFTPTQDYFFDSASLWLMSNSNVPGATLTISLQTNLAGGLAPSGTSMESWNHATATAGWEPALETLESASHTLLHAGTTYWIVAQSAEQPYYNPVWVIGGNDTSYTVGNIVFESGPDWQVGQTGGAPGLIINATPVPEPSVLLLGVVGAPLLLGATRRRAKAA